MDTILLVLFILMTPIVGVASIIWSESGTADSVNQTAEEVDVDFSMKKAA